MSFSRGERTFWHVSSRQEARQPIRVALAELPGLTDAFVRHALEEAGMQLVEPRAGITEGGLDADVLIVHRASTAVTDAYTQLVKANPGVRILTLTAPPHHEVFEFRLFGTNVRAEDVVDAVRDAMRCPLPRSRRAGN